MEKRTGTLRFWVARLCVLLLAGTFLFSGFAKAADPLGMCLKLNAYFQTWGFEMSDTALPLKIAAVTLATVEFMLGIYLLLGIRRRLTAIASGLLLATMTGLTAYIYIYNPVSDCGCFGAALQLTNGQTLAKNIVLLAAACYLMARPGDIRRLISGRNQWVTSIWALVYIIGLSLYSLHYLPLLDFTDFKRGASLQRALFDPDSEESRTTLANFYAETLDEESMIGDSLVLLPKVFLLTLPDEPTADDGSNDRINDLYDLCRDAGIPFYALIADEQTDLAADWTDRTGAAYPTLRTEAAMLKAMVRSNPGLLLLKEGAVAAKWSNNNLPESIEEAEQAIGENRYGLLALLLWFVVPLLVIVVADNIWTGSKRYKRNTIKQSILKQKKNHETENRCR